MHVKSLLMTLFIGTVSITGCTWVEPTEEGYAVALAKPTAVENCQSLGTATAEVPDTILFIPRSESKVSEELVTLGKNEAASMGGDTIVEARPPFQGRQKFRVYRCNQ